MKKIISLILALMMIIYSLSLAAFAQDEIDFEVAADTTLSLSAKNVILTEQTTGAVLYEKNADEAVPIASVTKIMTLLLIVENIDAGIIKLEDEVSVSENAASMGGSQMYLEAGEKISISDLLKAVFVASCNDGAVALAEYAAGSVEAFVERMNARAAELGMTTARFYNPTGLDDSDTNLLSARDVAIMSNALLSHELIYNYTKIWTDSLRGGAFGLANTNKLIRFYPGATGLKTGSTGKAKYCLSASAERNGLKLCAVVLGAETTKDRFADAKKLLDYGFAGWAFFTPPEFPDTTIKVWGGKAPNVAVSANTHGLLLEKSASIGIETRIELSDEIYAPIEIGQSVGKIIYEKNGTAISEIPILTCEKIEKRGISDIFRDILRIYFIKQSKI